MKLIVILLYCYIAIFPLGQIVKLPVQLIELPEINLYLTDMLIFLLVSCWLGWRLITRRKLQFPPLGRPVLAFFIVTLVSLLVNYRSLSGGEIGVALLYSLRWVVYAGVYFVIYDLGQSSKFKVQSISNGLVLVGLLAAIFGLLQYLFLPDTRFLEKWGWDPHYYRVIGTFLDPGFLGLILVLTLIPLVIKLWPFTKLSWRIAAWLIIYIALALTYSRASYLAYLGSMGTIAWIKKSPKFFLGILMVGIVTVLLLPRPGGEGVRLERESTIKLRVVNWQQSLAIAKDHFILGIGFNAYRYAQKRYGFLDEQRSQVSHAGGGADSSLLFVLATTGILGLAAYLWLWMRIIKFTIYNLPASPAGGQFTIKIAILASVVALFIHSLFLNSLFYPWVMGWFWILLGVTPVKEYK